MSLFSYFAVYLGIGVLLLTMYLCGRSAGRSLRDNLLYPKDHLRKRDGE